MRYLALYILLVVGFSANAQQVSVLDKDLDYAEYLVKNDHRSLAYSSLNQIIKKHPSNARAYFLRSENYFLDKNYKAAIHDIDLAIEHKSRIADYHELRGKILFCQKKYSASGESFENCIKLADTLAVGCYYFAANSFYLAENYEKASESIKKYLEIVPDADSAKSLYAEILASNGDEIEALRIVNSSETKNAEFYRLRGIIYCKSQLYDYALKDLNQALDLKPSLTDIYLWRGLAYYFSDDTSKAHNDWTKALEFKHFKAKDYLEKYR